MDGDGASDLLVSTLGTVHFFLNDGHGHFQEATGASGRSSLQHRGHDLALWRTWTGTAVGSLCCELSATRPCGIVSDANSGGDGERKAGGHHGERPASLTGPELAGWITLDPNGDIRENGQADLLYRNVGHGRFTPLSFTDGTFLDEQGKPLTSPLYDWTLTAMFRDLNGDGAPDLYVCSDLQSPDRIWINRGTGISKPFVGLHSERRAGSRWASTART